MSNSQSIKLPPTYACTRARPRTAAERTKPNHNKNKWEVDDTCLIFCAAISCAFRFSRSLSRSSSSMLSSFANLASCQKTGVAWDVVGVCDRQTARTGIRTCLHSIRPCGTGRNGTRLFMAVRSVPR